MNAKGKILIIDDNEDVLFALNLLLDPYVEKIKVTTQPTRIEHFMTTFQPDVILLDMNFRRDAISGQEGFDCLEQILKLDPQAIVLFMTAYADTDKAVRAIKAGAIDFIPKPWEKEKLLATLSSAIKLRDSRKEVRQLKEQVVALSAQDEEMPQMIGHSAPMREVFDTIRKLSDTDANILILGENGTGKDLVARSLRYFSPRRECPFITIDLGSIPESLFESELFGYEKGAFTDARKAKAGRMEVASGGTLFLDEIGNLSLPMQAKLLTAIEKRQISRLGATDIIPIDVRLISATNVNIRELVEEGNFRQDLLYRINTIEITIPPLRERGEAGLFTGILMGPVLPFINDTEDNVIQMVRLAHLHEAKFIHAYFGVTLRDRQRDYYYEKLDEFFPGLKEKYMKYYGSRYNCNCLKASHLWRVFQRECKKYGLLYKMDDIIKAYKTHQQKFEQLTLF